MLATEMKMYRFYWKYVHFRKFTRNVN